MTQDLNDMVEWEDVKRERARAIQPSGQITGRLGKIKYEV
jgi:hypothetical protein